ncbi:MAG TPA: Ig-like domain-containing protein [Candidatus Dormibacteraeota bacterium]|nr:Ig-like domain-containing protein [Candidatus Dormibacteraeota bacterium]
MISLSPANGTRGVGADEPVVVTFDRSVDPSTVATRFHVAPPLGHCDVVAAFAAPASAPCSVTWRSADSAFTFVHPGAPFAPDSTYRFTLDPGVEDTAGAANGLDHHWQLVTASAPVVRTFTPADGSTGVAVDAPLAIGFSSAMLAGPTEGAIHLDPPVPGTRVAVNTIDRSRYVVLPGRLLAPGTVYTLRVDGQAQDEHGQPLAAPTSVRFTTGGLGRAAHAIVLERRAGEAPTLLELTRRSPDEAGEPAAAVALLQAAQCLGTACSGRTTVTYTDAAISPAGNEIAVVEHPDGATEDRLVLVSVPGLAERILATPGGLPSWSPDGSAVAFASGDRVALFHVASGLTTLLPEGDPLAARPAWSDDGATLALTVARPGEAPHVELADPDLLSRYAVPGLFGPATDPALSPDASVLAVRRDGTAAGTWLVDLRSGAGSVQLLDPTLTPIAWTDGGTLVGVSRPAGGADTIVRANVAGGGETALTAGPRPSDLSTVVADVAGRSLGFLLPDPAGVVQAWAMNLDGSNPTQLTTFAPGDGLEAASVSLGG